METPFNIKFYYFLLLLFMRYSPVKQWQTNGRTDGRQPGSLSNKDFKDPMNTYLVFRQIGKREKSMNSSGDIFIT